MSTRLSIENYDELYLVATMHPDKVVRAHTGIEIVDRALREIDSAHLQEALESLTTDKNLAGVAQIRAGKAWVNLLAREKKLGALYGITIAKSRVLATVRTYAKKRLEKLGGIIHIETERESTLNEENPLKEREEAGEKLVGELDKRGDVKELVKIFKDEKYPLKTRLQAWKALKRNFEKVLESNIVSWIAEGFEGFSVDELRKISDELIELLVEGGNCYQLEHMALQTKYSYENLPGWIAKNAEAQLPSAFRRLLELAEKKGNYERLVGVRKSELLESREKKEAKQLLDSIVIKKISGLIEHSDFFSAIKLLHDGDVPRETREKIKELLDSAVVKVSRKFAGLGLNELREKHYEATRKKGPLGNPPDRIVRRRPMRIS